MSSAAPAGQYYPSTPQSIPEEFSGLQQIADHNHALSSHQYGECEARDPYQTGSGYNSTTYGSPASNQWIQDGHLNERGNEYSFMRGNDMGYDWGDDPMDAGRYIRPYPTYPVIPGEASYARMASLTPTMSDHSGVEARRNRVATRSGLQRETKSRKARKAAKKEKSDVCKDVRPLAGPISELSKDSKVPKEDIAKLVCRPAEERELEVKKNKGHWKRPMNSFMLYRKAYWKRVQELDGTNNHQKISCLVKESWKMEPKEVKAEYAEYSRMDKAGLMAANPGYKFKPKTNPGKKRKGDDMDSEDEGQSDSDLMHKQARITMSPPVYPGTTADYGWGDGHQRSAYQTANPGRPLPAPMDDGRSRAAFYGQYQRGVHEGFSAGNLGYSDPFNSVMQGPMSGSAPTGVPGTTDNLLEGFEEFNMEFDQGQNVRAGLDEGLNAYGTGAFTGKEFESMGQEGIDDIAWGE